MKSSFYNVPVRTLDKDQVMVFNTLANSLVLLDGELFSLLETPDAIANKNPQIFVQLKKSGIIVPNELNEKDIYRANYEIQRFRSRKSDFMVTVTYACNLDCDYCFESKENPRSMGSRILYNVLKFIKYETLKNGSDSLELQIFGGEPFANRDATFRLMDEMSEFSYINQVRFGSIIYTNGTLYSEDILEKLEQHKKDIKYVHVTIDGPKDYHDQKRCYRNKEGSYDKVLEFLRLLNQKEINNVMRVNINQSNLERIPELLDNLVERGFGRNPLYFGFLRHMTHSCGVRDCEESQPNKCLPGIWEEALKRKMNIKVKPETAYSYCSAFKESSFVIGVNGELYKCAGLQGIAEHCVGQINTEGKVGELTDRYSEFMARDPLKMKPCGDCKNLPVCGGGCASYSFTHYGKYHHPDCFNKSKHLTSEGVRLFIKYQGPAKFRDLF